MSVSKKAKKENKAVIKIAILILILLILGGFRIILNYNSVRISSRVNKIKEFKKEEPNYNISGWLRIPRTNIDYPVLKDFDKIVDDDGTRMDYLWENGKLEKLNNMNFIIGHNVMNLSANPLKVNKDHVRFEQLMSFTYLDFAKKNQYIQFIIMMLM